MLEFPLVHCLNFVIYLLSLASFLFFLNAVLRMMAPGTRVGVVLIACSSFLYCTLDFTTLAYVTPDLLVSVFAFAAAGVITQNGRWDGIDIRPRGAGCSLSGSDIWPRRPFLFFGLLCSGDGGRVGRASDPLL